MKKKAKAATPVIKTQEQVIKEISAEISMSEEYVEKVMNAYVKMNSRTFEGAVDLWTEKLADFFPEIKPVRFRAAVAHVLNEFGKPV